MKRRHCVQFISFYASTVDLNEDGKLVNEIRLHIEIKLRVILTLV